MQAMAPLMRQGGAMVNVASIAAFYPSQSNLGYAAFSEREVARRLASGEPVGSMSSQLKLSASTLLQRATELEMEALGPYAMADQRAALGSLTTEDPVGPPEGAAATSRYLNTRAVTIYGGTYEVQHNILARQIGL
ncbi:MAG TPA: acyl-CoA dehydrogenase family protein [Caulobacteraceae bacterium]|jgi:alkylation response protein AidB-like acyl-CoA dehydrogenase